MNNIIEEYITFFKKQMTKYSKNVLEKYFDSKIFNQILEEYINIRYYNYYNIGRNVIESIQNKLEKKIENLKKEVDDKKIIIVDYTFDIFKQLLYLDFDYSNDDILIVEKNLNMIRKGVLNYNEKYNISLDYQSYKQELDSFLKNYETKDFYVEYSKAKFNSTFDCNLKHNLKIPKLYSEYAVNRVFNKGLINEDKLFVLYNLVGIKVLKEIIAVDFKTNYIVDFDINLFEKKEKLNRLLKIINNDIAKEKISLKITYSEFINSKNDIFKLINEGFNFAIILDETCKNNDYLSLFKYVIK